MFACKHENHHKESLKIMAKAIPLTIDALKTPQITPMASTPARSVVVSKPSVVATKPKIEQVPLQVRIPKDAARAIKVAAAERDQTISDFMLACFHAYMKTSK
jgi:hypothetical protein